MTAAAKVFEALPGCETRSRPFALSAAGRVRVFESPSRERVEIVEVALQCVDANTFQVFAGNRAMTPVYDFSARMFYSDPGFFLEADEDGVYIETGGAGVVRGVVRWRDSRRDG